MKKECGICGKQYTARRKLNHIKTYHKKEAYEFFIENISRIKSVMFAKI
jgi:hypothetical protein